MRRRRRVSPSQVGCGSSVARRRLLHAQLVQESPAGNEAARRPAYQPLLAIDAEGTILELAQAVSPAQAPAVAVANARGR